MATSGQDGDRTSWDVVVVGAGPAGAVASLGLARAGVSVLLVDRASFPRWKVCGCCLSPHAQETLIRAGLEGVFDACGAVTLTALRLAARHRRATLPLNGWKALSRERFDAALIAEAQRSGAVFRPRTHARVGPSGAEALGCDLALDDGRERSIAASLVLAADGLAGQVASRSLPGGVRVAAGSRVGAGVTVADVSGYDEPGQLFMAYGEGGYLGLVRLEDGRLNLAAAWEVGHLRRCGGPGPAAARLLAEVGWPAIPDLADRPWRGTPALTRRPVRPAAARLLVLGDAAGYVEPFTGEGMAWALEAAVAVVPLALRACRDRGGTPALADAWTDWHRQRRRRRQRLIRTVAWVARRPGLSRAVIDLADRFPGVAGRVMDWLFPPSAPGPLPPPGPVRSPASRTDPACPGASSDRG